MSPPASLSSEEVRTFLESKPGWIVLTTIGTDGYPHSVPLGYFCSGEDIYLGCMAGSQKTCNIERNPRVSLMLEGDHKGVMIKGDGSVISDPTAALELSRQAARQRGTSEEQLPTSPRPGVAYIRVRPRRVLSWDYSHK